jgi:hypothetical protein
MLTVYRKGRGFAMLELAEARMAERDAEAERIYDAVAGRAVDREYENLRRKNSVLAIGRRRESAARRVIWC